MSYDYAGIGAVLPPSIGYGLDTAGINTAGQFLNAQYGPTLPSIFPGFGGGCNPLASYAMTTGASQSFDIDGDLSRGYSGGFGGPSFYGSSGFYGGAYGLNDKEAQRYMNMTQNERNNYNIDNQISMLEGSARYNDRATDIGIAAQVRAEQSRAVLEAPQQAIMQDVGVIRTLQASGQSIEGAFNKLLADVKSQNPRLNMDQVKAKALTYCGSLPTDIMNGESSMTHGFMETFLGGLWSNGGRSREENLAYVLGTSVPPVAARQQEAGKALGLAANVAGIGAVLWGGVKLIAKCFR